MPSLAITHIPGDFGYFSFLFMKLYYFIFYDISYCLLSKTYFPGSREFPGNDTSFPAFPGNGISREMGKPKCNTLFCNNFEQN